MTISLEPGEVICPKCKGTGVELVSGNNFHWVCDECTGTGKVDWIQNIVGKKQNVVNFFKEDDIGLGYLSHPDNIYLDDD